MEYIKVTKENIEKEHICCAISNDNDVQVSSKKAWLSAQFDNGLVFLKANARGKCFIEYLPAENAWAPISADGYLYINCLWVSGSFKGNGYSNDLLNECINDAKKAGKKGLVILSSDKKYGFLADKKYLEHKGFKIADYVPPYFLLMYLQFDDSCDKPKFNDCVKTFNKSDNGFTLYYTNQCPFTAKYVPLLCETANRAGLNLKAVHIESKEQAQSARCPFTTFSLWKDGDFVTHEILSPAKFLKIIETYK